MAKDISIRLLRADEIECRIAMINENGLSILLYKDARVDQRILDETFGLFGWKRSHQSIEGNLYCTVEILNKETGDWISKQDVGTSSYSEKEKGQASDAFKRACFNIGVGRELYSAPFVWLSSSTITIQRKGERFICKDSFVVQKIDYNAEREITELVIATEKGKVVYEWKKNRTVAQKSEVNNQRKMESGISKEQLKVLNSELERTGVDMGVVKERYGFETPEKMSEDTYNRVIQALAKTKSEKAA